MKIQDHKLTSLKDEVEISFEETPNHSGQFAEGLPDTIVIHYTAGASLESSANWLKNPEANASAHLVVGKSGKIIQLAPFNIKTWHAGTSSWKGREKLNNFSIGIEIDNAGLLSKHADGYYTYFNKKIDDVNVLLAKHKFDTEEKAWESYTEKQISAVEEICIALVKNYNIVEILGHDDIAPKRKKDPGPAFPLQQLKDKILYGRKEESEDDESKLITSKGIVTANFLNIRSKPSIQSPLVNDPLPKGTKVQIVETKDDWMYVKVLTEGWVSKKWVKTF